MAAIVVMAAACGGSGGDTSPDATAGAAESATTAPTTTELPATEITEPSEPATSEAATTVPATTESVEPVDEEWMAVAADGCMCADGGPFELWERPADPTKVVLYFEGGGACFSAESCSFTDGTYVPNIDLGVSPDGRGGIFDQT
ncbi:MAG: hypothetical protein P8L16_01285, partial [Ilumatobacter sp.]|nr:hypothetical protein [Ilumatobacter sp.]